MTSPTIPPVRHTVTVNASAHRAFEVFTTSIHSWWPAGHHIGAADRADVQLEHHVGGRLYERGVDGTECDWGRVLAYDPPHKVVLAWHLGGDWTFVPDPAQASEVEVTFTAEAPHRTRVELVHRHIERHGPTAESLAKQVSGDGGWGSILAGYAETTAGQPV